MSAKNKDKEMAALLEDLSSLSEEMTPPPGEKSSVGKRIGRFFGRVLCVLLVGCTASCIF